ncbi:MAG: NAD(P)(+) transhydrogenase (Re/Si-specific) subunit alpha [Acidobacteria bacterium]|nr:MAG: NAD(P)(+) transhydrogenase (Re/Si-specific) subunit alpha [Acidobacteriota bacterium]
MIVGAPKEIYPGERRVALTPVVVPMLAKAGLEVAIEAGAGVAAGYPDALYKDKGAKVLTDRAPVFAQSDIIVQVLGHGANDKNGESDLRLMRRGLALVGFLRPLGTPTNDGKTDASRVQEIAQTGVTAFAVELMPRTTRAQSMDALSSMASIAGYKAVLEVANALPRIFPMMTTAAGTITPSRVLIIGVGVAGLQAIATARRLGAVVSAYDVRPAVKEQVQSLGARFVELPLETQDAQDARGYAKAQDEAFYAKQRELLGKVIAENDAVITTAVVPGKKAPVLVTAEMVKGMAPGSVVLDMAAERGGNCEVTRAGETVVVSGVSVIGPINLASGVPHHASQMYARNLTAFLANLVKDGKMRAAESDDIIRDTLLTQDGEVVNARVRELLGMPGLVASQ